jgi:hypothetical protein
VLKDSSCVDVEDEIYDRTGIEETYNRNICHTQKNKLVLDKGSTL